MLKYIILIIYSFLLLTISAQENNYKYCNNEIENNNDTALKSIFNINPNVINTKFELIKNNLYSKNSIYYVTYNYKKSSLIVYHLASVHFEDLKLLLEGINLPQLDFISTITTEFKPSYQISNPQNVNSK